MDSFFFDPTALSLLAEKYREPYRTALPFPHCVIDRFLPQEVADRLLDEFPGKSDIVWEASNGEQEVKYHSEDETQFPPFIRHVLYACHSSVFVTFLEKLTGIDGLIADPHVRGAGITYIARGGKLGIHADFNRNKRLKLDRRLNLLLYMNKDWKEEYGGHIELWSRDMKTCVKKVLPVFNRCLIFSTTDDAFHGHPDPLSCPEDRMRQSLSLYFYSNGRPEEERSEVHTTRFRLRPGEKVPVKLRWRDPSKYIPPIAVDLVRSLRQR